MLLRFPSSKPGIKTNFENVSVENNHLPESLNDKTHNESFIDTNDSSYLTSRIFNNIHSLDSDTSNKPIDLRTESLKFNRPIMTQWASNKLSSDLNSSSLPLSDKNADKSDMNSSSLPRSDTNSLKFLPVSNSNVILSNNIVFNTTTLLPYEDISINFGFMIDIDKSANTEFTSLPKYNEFLVPFTLSLYLNDSDINISKLEGMKSIVSAITSYAFCTPIDMTEMFIRKLNTSHIVIYEPIYKGYPIYGKSNYVQSLRGNIDLNKYYGYQYLSVSESLPIILSLRSDIADLLSSVQGILEEGLTVKSDSSINNIDNIKGLKYVIDNDMIQIMLENSNKREKEREEDEKEDERDEEREEDKKEDEEEKEREEEEKEIVVNSSLIPTMKNKDVAFCVDSTGAFPFLNKIALIRIRNGISDLSSELNIKLDGYPLNNTTVLAIFPIISTHKPMYPTTSKQPNYFIPSLLDFTSADFIIPNQGDERRLGLYIELAAMWEGNIKVSRIEKRTHTGDSNTLTISVNSKVDLGIPIKQWYNNAVESIMLNHLPIVILSGEWMNIVSANISTIEMSGLHIRMTYYATRAYLKLLGRYPLLKSQMSSLKILSDFRIKVALFSYKQMIEFQEILQEDSGYTLGITLENPSLNYSFLYRYSVYSTKSLDDAVVMRWYFISNYPDLWPLIIHSDSQIHSDDEDKNSYYICIEGYRGELIPSPTFLQLKEYKKDLETTLRQYYSSPTCDIITKQTVENIPVNPISLDNLTFQELLRLVPVSKQIGFNNLKISFKDMYKSKQSYQINNKSFCIFPPQIPSSFSEKETMREPTEEIITKIIQTDPDSNLVISGLYVKPSRYKDIRSDLSNNRKHELNIEVLDEETDLKQRNMLFGLSGYFDVGPIPGVLKLDNLNPGFRRNTEKVLTNIEKYDVGIIDISSKVNGYISINLVLKPLDMYTPLSGNAILLFRRNTEIGDPEENNKEDISLIEHLFDIKYTNSKKDISDIMESLMDYIGILWDKERFLSIWGKNLLEISGKLSIAPYRYLDFLSIGSDSDSDGLKVFNFLNSASMIYDL